MTTRARHHAYTYAEYVALEAESPIKHEFAVGEIYAMAGGTPRHAALSAAVLRLLGNMMPPGCRAYTSDLRIRVPVTGLSTYPDGAIVCGKSERAEDDELAIVNPRVLVEVTSPSSEEYDRGMKIEHYKRLASLREVIIVSHRESRVTVHRRSPDGAWSETEATEAGSIAIPSLGGELALDAIYDAVQED